MKYDGTLTPFPHRRSGGVWPKMENRSLLPGEPSLDHPGVPTGQLAIFCGLPALPRMCSDALSQTTVEGIDEL